MALSVGTATGGYGYAPSPALQPTVGTMQGSSPNLQPTATPGYNQTLISSGSAAPATTSNGTTGVNTNLGGTTTTTGSSGLYPAINTAEYNQGVLGKLNTATLTGQNTINQANNFLPTQQAEAQRIAGNAITSAQQQAAGQHAIYGTEMGGINSQRNLSLQELADQMHGQAQGLQAQLGSVGAGDSSAAIMGAGALAHEQNINSANVNEQALTQDNNLKSQEAQIDPQTQKYIEGVQAKLQSSITTIQQNYQNLMNEVVGQLGNAKGEAQQSLAYFGGQLSTAASAAIDSAHQQAVQAMAAINPTVIQQSQDATTALNNASGNLGSYVASDPGTAFNGGQFSLAPVQQAQAIQAPNISVFSPGASGNATAPAIGPVGSVSNPTNTPSLASQVPFYQQLQQLASGS